MIMTLNKGWEERRISPLVFLAFLLLVNILPAFTDSAGGTASLEHYMYLEDESSGLSFEDVLLEDLSFQSSEGASFRFGILDHPVWIKARFPSVLPDGTVLSIDSTGIQEAELYVPVIRNGVREYKMLQGGLAENLPEEDWGYRFMIYDLPQGIAGDEWLFFRFDSGGHTANFRLELRDSRQLRRMSWFMFIYLFLGIGIMLAMLCYNSVLYLFINDRIYIFYILYIFTMLLYQICHSGIGRLTGYPEMVNLSIPVSCFSYAFALFFAQYFLNLKSSAPGVSRALIFLVIISGAALLIWLIGQVALANRITHTLGVLLPMVLIYISVLRIRQGFLPARFYLAAWLVLGLSVFILVLAGLNLIPYNIVSSNAYVMGSAIESILLSMALGYRFRVLSRDQRRMREDELRLVELSITDDLTGLYNKRGYETKFSFLLNWARKNNTNLSLLVLDADHFKSFNDNYGHAEGDRALIELAQSIRDSIRDRDVACRYGGEEFTVILPGSSEKDACLIAERLRKNVESKTIVLKDGLKTGCTVSIGVSSLEEGDDSISLFERADSALYRAKESGRNRVMTNSSLILEVELPI